MTLQVVLLMQQQIAAAPVISWQMCQRQLMVGRRVASVQVVELVGIVQELLLLLVVVVRCVEGARAELVRVHINGRVMMGEVVGVRVVVVAAPGLRVALLHETLVVAQGRVLAAQTLVRAPLVLRLGRFVAPHLGLALARVALLEGLVGELAADMRPAASAQAASRPQVRVARRRPAAGQQGQQVVAQFARRGQELETRQRASQRRFWPLRLLLLMALVLLTGQGQEAAGGRLSALGADGRRGALADELVRHAGGCVGPLLE